MIRVRVDDYPQTRGEPQHTHATFREFHKTLTSGMGGRRYLLGVIPRRCTPEDILLLRNETDVVVGMHGISHDETQLDIHQNEFPQYMGRKEITRQLEEARDALQGAVGRPVKIYMPPRNRIDFRTVMSLGSGTKFTNFTTGPETDEQIRKHPSAIHSQFPHEYGRSDEMLMRHSHVVLREAENDVVLTLHWTWEVNIGLHHLKTFLAEIPTSKFADFDA